MTMQRGLRVTFGRQEIDDPRRQLELIKGLVSVIEELNREGKELHNCTVCFSAGVSAPVGQDEVGQSKYHPRAGGVVHCRVDRSAERSHVCQASA